LKDKGTSISGLMNVTLTVC